jgi:Glyoxalase/Bleomycin resistance protein/Dioxygenase superfamily
LLFILLGMFAHIPEIFQSLLESFIMRAQPGRRLQEEERTMKRNILGTRTVAQIGILVNDIETAAKTWADLLGVEKPPIRVTDEPEKSQARFGGKPTKARAKLAFFDIGPSLQLELIQPDGEQSTWREDLDRKGEGVHHIAFQIKGMKEKLEGLGEAGMRLLQTGEYTGGRYAYVDSSKDLKVTIELLEND